MRPHASLLSMSDHLQCNRFDRRCICFKGELPNPCSKEVKAKQDAVASEW